MKQSVFLREIAKTLFNGRLSSDQSNGCLAIIKACRKHGITQCQQIAYVLATAKHETAHTMMPIVEYGNKSYFNQYDAGTSKGYRLGNTIPGDGYKYRGRGYVQITGRRNYDLLGRILHAPLSSDPSRALRPSLAADIIAVGMRDGLFTSRRLSDYITKSKVDYENARRIVNGLDKSSIIADYARKFDRALAASACRSEMVVMEHPKRYRAPKPSGPSPEQVTVVSLLAKLVKAIIRIFFTRK